MTDFRGDSPRVDLTKQRQPASPPPVSTAPLAPPPPPGPRRGGGGRGPSESRRGLWVLAGAVAVILIGGVSTAALLAHGDDPAADPSSSPSLGSGDDTTLPDGEQDPGTSPDEATTEPTDEPGVEAIESPEPVDADADAVNKLDAIVASDSSASSALEGVWTAQLASSAPGEPPMQILNKYHDLKAQYPGALLIWSGDWPGSFGPSSLESWVVLSGDEYDKTRPLLEWCASEAGRTASVGRNASQRPGTILCSIPIALRPMTGITSRDVGKQLACGFSD